MYPKDGCSGVTLGDLAVLVEVDLTESHEPQVKCKGLFFRGGKDTYIAPSDGAFVERIRMRPLKKVSCPGCESCMALMDTLEETISNLRYGYSEVIIEPAVEDGGLYELRIYPTSHDEFGNVDDFDVGFYKVEAPSG